MPYRLKKITKNKYFVENVDTGKTYSKNPISLQKAKKQLQILEQNELQGGGLADLLKSAYQKTKNLVQNISQNISGRVSGVITGRGDNYPPADRQIIDKYADNMIVSICIYREKLAKSVNFLVNAISLGQFNKIKNKYGYDEMFHLMMVVTLDNGVPILLEKNEVINIHEYPNIKPTAEKMELNVPQNFNTSFRQFLDNGEKFMGSDYFTYDPMKNNCQRYIKSLILSNPPLEKENPNVIQWVEQDTGGLQRDLSPIAQRIFSGTTNLASRLNVLAKGKGFEPDNIEHQYEEKIIAPDSNIIDSEFIKKLPKGRGDVFSPSLETYLREQRRLTKNN